MNTTFQSLALEVIGQNSSGEMVSLFLWDWEFARVGIELLCGSGLVVPGNARKVPGKPTVTVYGSLSHLGRAVTLGEEDGGRLLSGEWLDFRKKFRTKEMK